MPYFHLCPFQISVQCLDDLGTVMSALIDVAGCFYECINTGRFTECFGILDSSRMSSCAEFRAQGVSTALALK